MLAIGSLLGDLVGSFIKRRLDIGRGAKAPILDQYNFIGGALIAGDHILPRLVHVIFIDGTSILALLLAVLIVTPILHRGGQHHRLQDWA